MQRPSLAHFYDTQFMSFAPFFFNWIVLNTTSWLVRCVASFFHMCLVFSPPILNSSYKFMSLILSL